MRAAWGLGSVGPVFSIDDCSNEICNGVDDDCDGIIDQFTLTFPGSGRRHRDSPTTTRNTQCAERALRLPHRRPDDVMVNISHPNAKDLAIFISPPWGGTVVLFQGDGSADGADFNETVFDDDGPQAVGDGDPPLCRHLCTHRRFDAIRRTEQPRQLGDSGSRTCMAAGAAP